MMEVSNIVKLIKSISNDDNRWYSDSARRFVEELESENGEGYVVDGVKFFYVDGKLPAEGEGENVWVVFHVENDPQLYRINGYYSSYDGTDWDSDSVEKVEARPRIIQEYYRTK